MAEGREYLQDVRLFSGLTGRDLDVIARVARSGHAAAGAILCREGEPGYDFYLIVAGEASVDKSDRELAHLGPGDHFGELALLDRGPRAATVTALTDMRLLIVSELDFTAVIDEVPALAHNLLAALARMVREAEAGQ
jgi:CRP-like cAMP-binding protein